MAVAVIVAVNGDREATVAAAIGAHPELTLARRCADLTEALAAAHAGLGTVVVLSEHDRLDVAVVAEFAGTGVALVGAPSDSDAGETLARLGIDTAIAPDADAAEIAVAVVNAAADAPEPLEPVPVVPPVTGQPGLMVAVWGPTGAPGRTTVATNLAAECAPLTDSALVVDIDTYGGAVAQSLGLLDEAPGIAALTRASLHGTLTDEVLMRHALVVTPGLRVLSGITRADRWPELSAAALGPIWDLVRRHATVTVVDCGFGIDSDEALAYDTRAPQRNGATLSALATADVVVIVGGGEPLGIQRLVQGLADLDAVGVNPNATRMVVVNRVRASVVGPRPDEAVADALRRYAGVESIWTIPHDPKACDAASLAGQVLRERAPRSPARRAIANLAHAIVALAAGEKPAAQRGPNAHNGEEPRAAAANLTD